MPRVLSDSESESAGPVLTSKQAPLRTRHKSTSSNEEVEKNGSEPVAGPSTTSTLKATADVNSDNEDEDDEEEEEVYVVEKVVSHTIAEDGGVYYEVKWKGYPSSDNTMEPEDNLEGARDLLEIYFAKLGGHPSEVGDVKPQKKRGRKSAGTTDTPPPSKKAKGESTRASGRGKASSTLENGSPDDSVKWPDVKVNSDWVPPKPRKDAWEDYLLSVHTIEVDSEGKKWAFVLWSVEDEHGRKRTSKVLLPTLSIAAPQALIKFYEQHLVFTKSPE